MARWKPPVSRTLARSTSKLKPLAFRCDQSVQGLGVGIGDGMIEIGKDRFIPVAYSSQQWLKSSFQVRRDAGFPVLIGGFCLFTVAFLPDIEKALFEPVGGFQIRKVLRP